MLKKLLIELIDLAKTLGLGEVDSNNAKELLNNREYGLAFDTIITQLYEYEIEIDNQFYDLLVKIAQKIEVPEEDHSFMKELIRAENGSTPKKN